MRTTFLLIIFLILSNISFSQRIDDKIKYLRELLPARYSVDFDYDTIRNNNYRNTIKKYFGVLKISDSNSKSDTLRYSVYKAFVSIDSLRNEYHRRLRFSNCTTLCCDSLDFVIKDYYFSLDICSLGMNQEFTTKMSQIISQCAELKYHPFEPEKSIFESAKNIEGL